MRRDLAVTALTSCVLLAGCASDPAAPAVVAMTPTPYTAESIRDAIPLGTELVFHVTAAGQPAVRRTMLFSTVTTGGCIVEGRARTEDGTRLGPPEYTASTWTELRDHAAFPAATTSRTRTRCTVPTGTFDCWAYTVRGDADGVATVSRFYFALDRPGPPVRYEHETPAGNVVFTMEMIEDSRP